MAEILVGDKMLFDTGLSALVLKEDFKVDTFPKNTQIKAVVLEFFPDPQGGRVRVVYSYKDQNLIGSFGIGCMTRSPSDAKR